MISIKENATRRERQDTNPGAAATNGALLITAIGSALAARLGQRYGLIDARD